MSYFADSLARPAGPASRRRGPVFLLCLLAIAGPVATVAAQTVYCGPGTQVISENGGGTGTIAEIGTEPPHVGWYRVTFSWSPGGEWYDPPTWKLYAAGTRQRCSPRKATPPATPPQSSRPEPRDDDEPAPVRVPRPRSQPPAPSGGDALPLGRYTCSMPGAGQFPITIVDGSTYSDRGGKSGRYRLQGQQLLFDSGSLRGTYSRILGPGKFGLSLDQNSSFYGVCNLKR